MVGLKQLSIGLGNNKGEMEGWTCSRFDKPKLKKKEKHFRQSSKSLFVWLVNDLFRMQILMFIFFQNHSGFFL